MKASELMPTMFNTRLEVGTSMVGIMATTVEIREISTPTRRVISQVADKGATKDGTVLVVIDREHRIRSSMVVRAIMAIRDSAPILCNRLCVLTVERMATLQGFAASVTGALRPDGLVFTRPCKIFQAKVFKEKKKTYR